MWLSVWMEKDRRGRRPCLRLRGTKTAAARTKAATGKVAVIKASAEIITALCLDSVKPTYLTLGYDRHLCSAWWKIENGIYTNATGQQLSIRSSFVRQPRGRRKIMEIWKGCGDVKVTTSPERRTPLATRPYTVKRDLAPPRLHGKRVFRLRRSSHYRHHKRPAAQLQGDCHSRHLRERRQDHSHLRGLRKPLLQRITPSLWDTALIKAQR